MTDRGAKQISYDSEILRKGIHLTSLLIPIVYLNINHRTGIAILLVMMLVSFLIDVGRHFHEPTRRLMMKVVGPLLRSHEIENGHFRLTGATWVLIAATLTLGLFPTVIGITSFTVLIVCDTFAALIGRKYGEKPFLDKSVVGTLTFAVSASAVVALYGVVFKLPWTYWVAGAIGGLFGAIAEASSVRLNMDDNIVIPFSTALSMIGVNWMLTQFGFSSFLHLIP